MASSGLTPKAWKFGQCFGEKDADEEFSEADVLSAVEFDDTGDFLATGDKGGRIVIFERADPGKVGACSRPLWIFGRLSQAARGAARL
jgi:serine/threonine-protein phosphatase 2A regulatory subunit B